ncbi:MAG TPA: hypothetical protein VKB93_26415, partial [Thermoanaerobaculia bacterium]|nr:hypothetical protein [Thermoanaerobaculia bacterium]
MRVFLLIRLDHRHGAQPRAAQEFLGPAHRPADGVRDLLYRVPFRESQPQNLLLARRQRPQHFMRRHALDLRRLDRALVRFARDHASLLPPILAAGVADCADEPGPDVVDVAPAEIADEDVVHECLRFVARHAELTRGDRPQQRRERGIPLFRRT